jgi:hypothetical protein
MRRVPIAIAAASVLIGLPTVAGAHEPGVVLRGFGSATIDGRIEAGEWASAATAAFPVALVDGRTAQGRLFVMNDTANVYAALRVEADFTTGLGRDTVFSVQLDGEHSGARFSPGQDLLYLNARADGDVRVDDWYVRPGPPGSGFVIVEPDSRDGGSNDVRGAFRSGGVTEYELSRPLDSSDDRHDVSTKAHARLGFLAGLRLCPVAPCDRPSDTGFPAVGTGDLVVASAVRPGITLATARIEGGWRKSVLDARLVVEGTAQDVAELELTLRGGTDESSSFSIDVGGGGAFRHEFRLPETWRPGDLELRVDGVDVDGFPLQPETRALALAAPPEGIVEAARVSLTRGGAPVTRIPWGRSPLWATFDVASPASTSCRVRRTIVVCRPPVTVTWYGSRGRRIPAALRSVSATSVVASLAPRVPLGRGSWRVVLRVGGTTAYELSIVVV